MLVWLWVMVSVLVPQSAFAGIDHLKISAFKSDRAARGLLLDVVDSGKHLVAVGERGHIVFSADQGKTWQQAEVPVYVTLTAVFFASAEKGWAVGHEGVVLHSRDGGQSWSKQLDGFEINEQFLKLTQSRFEAAQKAVNEAIDDTRREEAAIQLEQMEYAIADAKEDAKVGPAKPLLDVWFKNENEGYVVGSYGIFLHTDDGGENWSLWSDRIDNPDGFHLNAIAATDKGTILLVGEAGLMHRSSDDGKSWQPLLPPYEGSFFGLLNHKETLLTFGLRGSLFRSTDQGDSWTPINLPSSVSLAGGVVTAAGDITVVGGGGAVIHSSDGGNSFKLTVRPNRLPLSSVIELADKNMLAVGFLGVQHMNNQGVDLSVENKKTGQSTRE